MMQLPLLISTPSASCAAVLGCSWATPSFPATLGSAATGLIWPLPAASFDLQSPSPYPVGGGALTFLCLEDSACPVMTVRSKFFIPQGAAGQLVGALWKKLAFCEVEVLDACCLFVMHYVQRNCDPGVLKKAPSNDMCVGCCVLPVGTARRAAAICNFVAELQI